MTTVQSKMTNPHSGQRPLFCYCAPWTLQLKCSKLLDCQPTPVCTSCKVRGHWKWECLFDLCDKKPASIQRPQTQVKAGKEPILLTLFLDYEEPNNEKKSLLHFLDWSYTWSHVLHLMDEPWLTVDVYSFCIWEWPPSLVRFSSLHPLSPILSTNPKHSVLPALFDWQISSFVSGPN